MNRFSLVQWVFAFKMSKVIGTLLYPFGHVIIQNRYLFCGQAGGCISSTELTTRQK